MSTRTAAQTQSADTSSAPSHNSSAVPWRERPLLTMQEAAGIAGVSQASLYLMAQRGKLKLRKFAGRTMAETSSLAAALDGAEAWTPSDRNGKAVAARAERSRAAWAD
ncbi:helix-turn-helix domain-containing protein [Aureimonas leprariae]|nr:helix-turn-helix domain-containing protein [Aureimonas leprariae]